MKTSRELSAAVLVSGGVSVGKDKASLSLVEKDVEVCTTFGQFVKFTVSLDEPGVSSTHMALTLVIMSVHLWFREE